MATLLLCSANQALPSPSILNSQASDQADDLPAVLLLCALQGSNQAKKLLSRFCTLKGPANPTGTFDMVDQEQRKLFLTYLRGTLCAMVSGLNNRQMRATMENEALTEEFVEKAFSKAISLVSFLVLREKARQPTYRIIGNMEKCANDLQANLSPDVDLEKLKNCDTNWRVEKIKYIKCQISPFVEVDGKTICKSTLVGQLNGNPTLSKDRLTRVKGGVYDTFDKKVTYQSRTFLVVGSDCDVLFERLPSKEIRRSKVKGKLGSTNEGVSKGTWYLGRIVGMRRKLGLSMKETRGPIDLLDHPANVEIHLAWYQKAKGTRSYTYDLIDNQCVPLESVISIANLTYDLETKKYQLDANDYKVFNEYIKGKTRITTLETFLPYCIEEETPVPQVKVVPEQMEAFITEEVMMIHEEGNVLVTNFLDNLEMAFLVSGRDDEATKLRAFPLVLREGAKTWYQTLAPKERRDWETLKTAFIEEFRHQEPPEEIWRQLLELHQTSLNDYRSYEGKFSNLWEKWCAPLGKGERAPECLKKDCFLAGLYPILREKVKVKFPDTFENAMAYARDKDRKLKF
ncbi:hypothetical protein L7F22_000604 [Adiantum nelumboides]|nr:hypothetical protein [Adiantum nelumboides]